MPEILVLYYSRNGSVRQMAQFVARGIEMVPEMTARIRTVPAVSTVTEAVEADIPDSGAPYVEQKDLEPRHALRELPRSGQLTPRRKGAKPFSLI